MLSDRCLPVVSICPVCLSVCRSVTLVYCGQTVLRIKMKLGMQVGLSPSHIVLDEDPAPLPKRGRIPQFSAHVSCRQKAVLIKIPLGMEVGLGPGDFVLDENPAPHPPKGGGGAALSNFRPMPIVAKRLDGSRQHLARRWALVQATWC